MVFVIFLPFSLAGIYYKGGEIYYRGQAVVPVAGVQRQPSLRGSAVLAPASAASTKQPEKHVLRG